MERAAIVALIRESIDRSEVAVRVAQLVAGVRAGEGSPEGVVTAPVGTLYRRRDGGATTTLYVKESGTGNTGWVAK